MHEAYRVSASCESHRRIRKQDICLDCYLRAWSTPESSQDPDCPVCRILWAFARDGALPFSSTLQRVTKRMRVPVYAAIFTTLCCIILSLPILGSEVAFTACISMALVCESRGSIPPCQDHCGVTNMANRELLSSIC